MRALAGWLLVAGVLVFALGAGLVPSRVWTAPEEERQAIIAARPGRWRGSAVGLGIAVMCAVGGLALLTVVLWAAGGRALSILGLVAFGFGAVLFGLELVFRGSVMISAVSQAVGGVLPGPYAPLRDWAGAMYAAHMPLAYLGVALYGGAVLDTALPARWLGWLLLIFGILGAAVYVAQIPAWLWRLFDVPGIIYLVLAVLGVGLLLYH